MANEALAAIIATHPDRLARFAALPTQNPDLAVAELPRCVSELGFCGALIRLTNDLCRCDRSSIVMTPSPHRLLVMALRDLVGLMGSSLLGSDP